MLPFLSCCFTRLVAQARRFMFGDLPDADDVADELEPELGAEPLDVEEREKLLPVLELEFDDDEVLLLLPLLDRSSLRRSSLPREGLLRQSRRARSPERPRKPSPEPPRSRSRRSSRLPLSELEV